MDVELRDEDRKPLMFVAVGCAGEWWNALRFGGLARACLGQSAKT